jgi:putrescine carbamoyltransferase
MIAKRKDFIDTQDFTKEELLEIIDLGLALKKSVKSGYYPQLLKNKTLAMIFEEPSTRTRVSFEAAMEELGGNVQYLKPGEIHLGQRESLYDTAKVLSRMTDIIMCRALKHQTVLGLSKDATVPVINGLTDYNHPTQAVADVMTMIEHLPKGKKLEDCHVTFIGDRTNVCSSLMHITTKLGMHFTHAAPKKYQSPQEWIDIANENIKVSKGSVRVTEDVIDAVKDADFIYTDLWWWVDQEHEAEERKKAFMPTYQVTPELISHAPKHVKFMHCLPASRGVEVVDEVIDAPYSVVFDEAENRLSTERALLVYFLYDKKNKTKQIKKAKKEFEQFMKRF